MGKGICKRRQREGRRERDTIGLGKSGIEARLRTQREREADQKT